MHTWPLVPSLPYIVDPCRSQYVWVEKSAEDRLRDSLRAPEPPVLDQTFASFAHESIMRDVNLKMSGHDYHPELDVRLRGK